MLEEEILQDINKRRKIEAATGYKPEHLINILSKMNEILTLRAEASKRLHSHVEGADNLNLILYCNEQLKALLAIF